MWREAMKMKSGERTDLVDNITEVESPERGTGMTCVVLLRKLRKQTEVKPTPCTRGRGTEVGAGKNSGTDAPNTGAEDDIFF